MIGLMMKVSTAWFVAILVGMLLFVSTGLAALAVLFLRGAARKCPNVVQGPECPSQHPGSLSDPSRGSWSFPLNSGKPARALFARPSLRAFEDK